MYCNLCYKTSAKILLFFEKKQNLNEKVGEILFFLEWGFLLEFHVLSGLWMTELQTFGMEVHAVGCLSVERVAQNGAIHAVRMGGVDTKLMGTATLGIVGHAGAKMLLFIDEMGGDT